ncbi:MAG: ROK family protein [Pseudonocardiaceae bacterium]|nr:ROK family protein [Pseudonocardiaceae bacterium]
MTAPARQQTVRLHNMGLVVRHLNTVGPSSRAQIAAATGLTKGTVSSLVNDLLRSGLIQEPGVQARGDAGRPGSILEINTASRASLGLEINVDYMSACVADLGNRVRFHRVDGVDQQAAPEQALTRLAHLARAALEAAGSQRLTVCGVGVALPGIVDPVAGLLHSAPNLGWQELPITELLAERLAVPPETLLVDNEANLAALAELWCGRGPHWGDYLHVSGEIGIGAGVVVGGQLLRGSRGFAGEIGHVPLAVDGPPCACGGRGCLERYCGQAAILRAAGLDSAATTSNGRPDGSIARLLAALRAEDVRATNAVRDAAFWLGRGIGGVVNVLDVDTVVLGGIFAPLAPWLEQPFTEAVHQQMIAARWAPVEITASKLGPDAAVRGAAGLVTQRVLADPGAMASLDPANVTAAR